MEKTDNTFFNFFFTCILLDFVQTEHHENDFCKTQISKEM